MVSDIDLVDRLIRQCRDAERKVIRVLQTTYLEIDLTRPSGAAETWRVHYSSKVETHLKPLTVDAIALTVEHPLLIDYSEATVDVHLKGLVEDKQAFAAAMNAAAQELFAGWRPYTRYLTRPLDEFLQRPFGLLLTGPKSYSESVARLGPSFGVELSMRNEQQPRGKFKALILDDLYVIANDFRAERIVVHQ